MLFNSVVFIVGFLPITLACFHAFKKYSGGKAARLWLLIASLIFYGWWSVPPKRAREDSPENGAQPHDPADASRARRRGDRVRRLLPVVGTKRRWRDVRLESAFGGKAEVGLRCRQGRF
jgi:hypothetical protein